MDVNPEPKQGAEGEIDSPDPPTQLRLANDLFQQGEYSKAVAAAQRALQLGLDTPEARLLLGKAWGAQGYPIQAAFQFRQLLSRHPDHAEAAACHESVRRIVAAVDAIRSTNPRELQIDIRRNVIIITLVGMMAPYTDDEDLRGGFDRLTMAIARLLQLGLTGCVVDLTHVHFVTSFFLGMLLEWRRRIYAEGRVMAVCVTRPEIHDLLASSRISRLMPLIGTMEQAIQYVRAASGKQEDRHDGS